MINEKPRPSKGPRHTTRFIVFPVALFLVMAELGVSGSIKPLRMFLSSGTFPTSIQFGSVAHGSGGAVCLRTKVLIHSD